MLSGLRPFGVSFLWAGWDKHYGFQLYQSDPSGISFPPPSLPPMPLVVSISCYGPFK